MDTYDRAVETNQSYLKEQARILYSNYLDDIGILGKKSATAKYRVKINTIVDLFEISLDLTRGRAFKKTRKRSVKNRV